jgi:hypothetical protein
VCNVTKVDSLQLRFPPESPLATDWRFPAKATVSISGPPTHVAFSGFASSFEAKARFQL